jgi:hypothetical protein
MDDDSLVLYDLRELRQKDGVLRFMLIQVQKPIQRKLLQLAKWKATELYWKLKNWVVM